MRMPGPLDLFFPLQCNTEGLDPAETRLWFGDKVMHPAQKLRDYLGNNEKTRAVVKLQHSGAGAPPREPVGVCLPGLAAHALRVTHVAALCTYLWHRSADVILSSAWALQVMDPETQQAMTAWYYKRQEEQARHAGWQWHLRQSHQSANDVDQCGLGVP
jgi:hypothetical protein